MKTEEIIKRLRHPKAYQKAKAKKEAQKKAQVAAAVAKKRDILLPVLSGAIAILVGVTFLFVLMAQNRAENLTEALDPDKVKGLQAEADFNPNTGVTYIQVQEGKDRNVAVTNLGTTLPIISRFNFKSLTPQNYEVIGAAPWALTENFNANLNDPELIRYLLSKEEVAQAFMAREEVAPLLEDPQLLIAMASDTDTLCRFFEQDVVKKVFASEQMVRQVAGSRFMSHLLISPTGKYLRKNPQESAQLIASVPCLRELHENKGVQQAVKENPYLKDIASVLLGPVPSGKPATREQGSTLGTKNKKK